MNHNLRSYDNVHLKCQIEIRKRKYLDYKIILRRLITRYKFAGLKSIKCEIIFTILILYLFFRIIHSLGKCKSDEGTIEGWDYNTSRNTTLYIQPERDTTLLLPENFCTSKVYVFIMVCSSPDHFAMRHEIRNTWSSLAAYDNSQFPVVTYFLIGRVRDKNVQRQIDAEYFEWNDVIQEDFIDSYNNLTIKSLMMLKVITKHCLNTVRYLMKTDDDVYLQITALVNFLKAFGRKNMMVGCLMRNSRVPKRSITSKWFAPCYLYERMDYPLFLSGTGYVMSIDVVPQLYMASFNISIYYLEDVYITGLLSEAVELKLGHSSRFSYLRRSIRDPCIYWRAITSHKLKVNDFRNHFAKIQETNLLKCAWQIVLNAGSVRDFYWKMKSNYILSFIFILSYLQIFL